MTEDEFWAKLKAEGFTRSLKLNGSYLMEGPEGGAGSIPDPAIVSFEGRAEEIEFF